MMTPILIRSVDDNESFHVLNIVNELKVNHLAISSLFERNSDFEQKATVSYFKDSKRRNEIFGEFMTKPRYLSTLDELMIVNSL